MPSETSSSDNMPLTDLNAEIIIDASPAQVWDVVGTNFDEITRYSNGVQNSYYLNQTDTMVGSQRRSEMRNGRTLDVEITAWEEQSSVEWQIIKAHIPILKAGVSRYSLSPIETKTRLSLDGGFRTAVFLLKPIAKRKFRTVVTGDLAGIKHLVETGEQVSDATASTIIERYGKQVMFR